jgi:hypothetical protein
MVAVVCATAAATVLAAAAVIGPHTRHTGQGLARQCMRTEAAKILGDNYYKAT